MKFYKRMFIKLFSELKYQKTLLNKINGKRGGDSANSREVLMGYSPRPDGYYVGACNKPIDVSIDLSIIVPIYNVECYLEECLSSIINQVTRYRFEILCVDDGSPDNSIDILRKYEKNYSVVKVIRQKNRGLSGARNRGLDEATGKYVMFILG